MKALLLCVSLFMAGRISSAEVSIYRMVVGNRALEVQDTFPLTTKQDGEVRGAWVSPDGKYIAYFTSDDADFNTLYLIRSSGGRPEVILSPPAIDPEATEMPKGWWPEVDTDQLPAEWSPDSKLIAFLASRTSPDSEQITSTVLIMTMSRAWRASFDLPDRCFLTGRMLWSKDSLKLACAYKGLQVEPNKPAKRTAGVIVYDLVRKSSTIVFSRERADIVLVDSWSADAKRLSYYVSVGGKTEMRESKLDGSPDELVQEVTSIPRTSPDGRFKLSAKPGLSIEDCVTGEVKEVFKEFAGKFIGWTPDSKVLVYRRAYKIQDEPKRRNQDLNMIWLAVPEPHRLNHMCVSTDADPDCRPTFSNDGLKAAYVSHGRLCLAQLGWADLGLEEKVAAGLPLTEEEEKQALMENAKQIGASMFMYASDNNDEFPSADSYSQDLQAYLGTGDYFNRPGTNDMAFQYTPLGALKDVKNPATTIVGSFDAGYGWKVILYADGHVALVPK